MAGERTTDLDVSLDREIELAVSDDPTDLSQIRLSQDFEEGAAVRKQQKLWAGKPSKQEFIRVRPGSEWTTKAASLELKDERETYIITADTQAELARSELASEVCPVRIFVAITAQGNLFLWPVKLAKLASRENEWHRSAMDAAEKAMTTWVRIVPNQQAKGYDLYEPVATFPEPVWPDGMTLMDLIRGAFKDRIIASLEHPVLKRLRGER